VGIAGGADGFGYGVVAERQADATGKGGEAQRGEGLGSEFDGYVVAAAGFEINRADDFIAAFFEEGAALGPIGPGVDDELAVDKDLGEASRIDADAVRAGFFGREGGADAGGEMERIDLAF